MKDTERRHMDQSINNLLEKVPGLICHYSYLERYSITGSAYNTGVVNQSKVKLSRSGMHNIVDCILETWLVNKGFAVGPSAGSII